MSRRKVTHEEFVARAQAVHGDRYEYPEAYQHSKVKLSIICSEHGTFNKESWDHLNGEGCPKCAVDLALAKRKKLTDEKNQKVLASGVRYCKVHGDQSLDKYYVNQWRGQTLIQCKACVRRIAKSNPNYLSEQSKAKARRIKREIRQEVLEHYSNGKMCCAICGENHYECLALDHINGGGNKHRAEATNYLSSFKKKGWPEGFRVLCHNCNMSRGIYGYSPYEVDHMQPEDLLRAMGLYTPEEYESRVQARRSRSKGVGDPGSSSEGSRRKADEGLSQYPLTEERKQPCVKTI
jgi:hypothetical protein